MTIEKITVSTLKMKTSLPLCGFKAFEIVLVVSRDFSKLLYTVGILLLKQLILHAIMTNTLLKGIHPLAFRLLSQK